MSSFRFLHLIRPFVGLIPEVAAPDRKVILNFSFSSYSTPILILYLKRSLLNRRSYGLPSLYSFSWSVLRFPCTVLCRPTLQILSTGCA